MPKIGLIDVDSKLPNLALMKLSAWHKQRGDDVKFWNAFEHFDQIYASKVFTNTPDHYVPKDAIRGGSGYNQIPLMDAMEHIYPDYSLYKIDYAMGYLTRGCINKCPFCIVPQKEGILHRHAELSEFWHGQKELVLLDNALTDFKPAWKDLEFIRDQKIKLDLCQGFNVRTIKPDCAEILANIKLLHQWRIAWDNIKDETLVMNGIHILNNAGIKNYRIMCYILVNYDSMFDQDLYRVKSIQKMGIDPFVMIYNRQNCAKKYQQLGKWCNRPQLRESCLFEEYIKEKREAQP
jgi:hypothetical protein